MKTSITTQLILLTAASVLSALIVPRVEAAIAEYQANQDVQA